MSRLDDLQKLIKLHGDEEKYAEGLKILNSNSLTAGNNANLISLGIGISLVAVALILNPSILDKVQQLVQGLQRQDAQTEGEEYYQQPPSTPAPTYPPLPPTVQPAVQTLHYRPY